MIDLINTVLYEPMYNLLIFFAYLIPSHSIGWAIIAITIVIRLALLPSSLKAARAQVRIQQLQPKINEIRKNTTDKIEQSKAMMELYKKEGVSQFGACLPLLIQLPILIVLYQVFRHGLDTSGFDALYSFVPRPETINPTFLGLDLTSPSAWVLPILAGLSQFFLSRLTMAKMPQGSSADPAMAMMRQMNFIFPLMNFFFARLVPSALSLYWVVTTVFSVGQQWYVNKTIKNQPASDNKEAVKEIEEKPEKKKSQKKRDILGTMVEKRLKKQEKKSGVNVTIRRKNS